MTMIRPGGETLTKYAIEKAQLPPAARVLDIGCGEGDTAAMLTEQFGFETTGIDQSQKLIDKGIARCPLYSPSTAASRPPDLRRMEAEFLDFESKTFDAVLMECSLSVFRLQEDAAFEAYCVLKNGGKLIITDLYRKNPDPRAVAKMIAEAKEKAAQPKKDGACGENERPSTVMLNGAFVIEELTAMLEEIGFELEHFEDQSPTIANFAAGAIMSHGSLAEYIKATVPEGETPSAYCACSAFWGDSEGAPPKDLGYFLMILKKP